MQIRITQQPDDGEFEVGETYYVDSIHKLFVFAFDEQGDSAVVYNYQFIEIL